MELILKDNFFTFYHLFIYFIYFLNVVNLLNVQNLLNFVVYDPHTLRTITNRTAPYRRSPNSSLRLYLGKEKSLTIPRPYRRY